MAFIQIMDFHTSRYDEGDALLREYEAAAEGRRTVRRSIVGQDRNDPTHYQVIVFFDSYESAMENSNLPETQELAAKMGALQDGPAAFSDLDVIEDRTF